MTRLLANALLTIIDELVYAVLAIINCVSLINYTVLARVSKLV